MSQNAFHTKTGIFLLPFQGEKVVKQGIVFLLVTRRIITNDCRFPTRGAAGPQNHGTTPSTRIRHSSVFPGRAPSILGYTSSIRPLHDFQNAFDSLLPQGREVRNKGAALAISSRPRHDKLHASSPGLMHGSHRRRLFPPPPLSPEDETGSWRYEWCVNVELA